MFHSPSKPIVSPPKALRRPGVKNTPHTKTHTHAPPDARAHRYNAAGNFKNWWSNSSAAAFISKASCFVRYFSGLGEDGAGTLGENLADAGGIKNSFETYKNQRSVYSIAATGVQVPLTDDQLFFVAYAQLWCEKMTPQVGGGWGWCVCVCVCTHVHAFKTSPQAIDSQLVSDPHSLSWLRVRGAVSNHPKFAVTFGCPAGSPMNPEAKCDVW